MVFTRKKKTKSGTIVYQRVMTYRKGGKVKQKVIKHLGITKTGTVKGIPKGKKTVFLEKSKKTPTGFKFVKKPKTIIKKKIVKKKPKMVTVGFGLFETEVEA